MKKFMLIILCSLVLFSCKRTKEDMITRKWSAASFESPALDAETERQRIFIDTVGASTDPETNERLYKVRNMDSMRAILRKEFDMIMEQRETTVKNTWRKGMVRM